MYIYGHRKVILHIHTLLVFSLSAHEKIYLLTFWPDYVNQWQTLEPNFVYYFLKEHLAQKGYTLEPRYNFSEDMLDGKYIIIFDGRLPIHDLMKIPKEKRILYLHEPSSIFPMAYDRESHNLYAKIFTWNTGLVDNKKYFHFQSIPRPSFYMIDNVTEFDKKKLCCLLANKKKSFHSHLDKDRIEAIDFFENLKTNEFDLYGRGEWSTLLTCYKGYIQDKIGTIKNYKFYLCYENTVNIPDYISEKIFDCFQAGTVPIYWGASNITDYIPKNCFIDRRDFVSMDVLYHYIKQMNHQEYDSYIQNIKKFLASDAIKEFSYDRFIEEMVFGLFN